MSPRVPNFSPFRLTLNRFWATGYLCLTSVLAYPNPQNTPRSTVPYICVTSVSEFQISSHFPFQTFSSYGPYMFYRYPGVQRCNPICSTISHFQNICKLSLSHWEVLFVKTVTGKILEKVWLKKNNNCRLGSILKILSLYGPILSNASVFPDLS